MKLNVLIACEESQVECKAFRELGHNAFSCDIQKCAKKANPEWHICSDVRPFLHGCTSFTTQAGVSTKVPKWDLVIAHPPCTYLCRVSATVLMKGGVPDIERLSKMYAAREFFLECLGAQAKYVAVENPQPMRRAQLPPPSCYACPSWFGDKYTKKTLYWLKNLPPLMAEYVCSDTKSLVHCTRGKYRSRTSPYLAHAIAKQWSEYVVLVEGSL